jgi:sorting nexin-29
MSGLRQGDSLACLLFNIALEKVIGDSGIHTRSTVFYKSVQLLAYAGDININGRSEHDIKKTFTALKTAADAMGLSVNPKKPNTWLRTVKVYTTCSTYTYLISFF